MATTSTKKGRRGKKKPSVEAQTDYAVAQAPPELQIPQAPAVPSTSKPPVAPKIAEPPPPPVPKRLIVKPIEDPKVKTQVTGRVSINFKYGPAQVCLVKGKKTSIPTVAVAHCKRLKYI